MRFAFTAVVVVSLCWAARAQAAPQKPCSAPEYRQLDFWVGDWDLTWPGQNGQPAQRGRNRIERELGDCVVHEHFSDQAEPPFQGTSVSTFTPKLGKWQQTWVDNQGSYLDLTGEFKDGQMVLGREAVGKDDKKIQQRMVFKNIKQDSFDWTWERSEDGGATWKVIWPIHYERRKS
jgi:Protein of unknown function (DUF1579)